MTIHTRKLPTFALYAAYADEFGVPVFGSTRDEALNNLADELSARQAVGEGGNRPATPAYESHPQTGAGGEGKWQ